LKITSPYRFVIIKRTLEDTISSPADMRASGIIRNKLGFLPPLEEAKPDFSMNPAASSSFKYWDMVGALIFRSCMRAAWVICFWWYIWWYT
jgi:hypothetical protein